MLDFYLLPDDQNIPDYPEEGEGQGIGGLDQVTFERLKFKKIIPERFDYYADFRWDRALVQQILENIQKQLGDDTDVKPLRRMLDAAKERDSGLVAYAD